MAEQYFDWYGFVQKHVYVKKLYCRCTNTWGDNLKLNSIHFCDTSRILMGDGLSEIGAPCRWNRDCFDPYMARIGEKYYVDNRLLECMLSHTQWDKDIIPAEFYRGPSVKLKIITNSILTEQQIRTKQLADFHSLIGV